MEDELEKSVIHILNYCKEHGVFAYNDYMERSFNHSLMEVIKFGTRNNMSLKDDPELEGDLNPDTWAGYDLPEDYKSQLPWFNEILWDSEIHEYAGLKFRVIRTSWGVWNGYVILPKGHIFHGKNMGDKEIEDLRVHGGVTYTDSGGGVWSKKNDWIIGFDTDHMYDFSPNSKIRNFNLFLDGCKNYKNHAYVIRETKNLIDSILFTMKYYS